MNIQLNTITDYIKYAQITAFFTFLVGTFIILFYYFTHNNSVIFSALFFIVTAFFFNTYFFLKLLFSIKKHKELKRSILFTLLFMFLNIPIGLLYLNFGFSTYSSVNI